MSHRLHDVAARLWDLPPFSGCLVLGVLDGLFHAWWRKKLLPLHVFKTLVCFLFYSVVDGAIMYHMFIVLRHVGGGRDSSNPFGGMRLVSEIN